MPSWGGCLRWRSRLSMVPARCGSTTRSGGSQVPTRRQAAGCESCRPMARASRWRWRNFTSPRMHGEGAELARSASAPAPRQDDAAAKVFQAVPDPIPSTRSRSPEPVRIKPASRNSDRRAWSPWAKPPRRRYATRATSSAAGVIPIKSANSSVSPNRSSRTMTGRPVREPRTRRFPGAFGAIEGFGHKDLQSGEVLRSATNNVSVLLMS